MRCLTPPDLCSGQDFAEGDRCAKPIVCALELRSNQLANDNYSIISGKASQLASDTEEDVVPGRNI